ncbi:MAG: transcriptional regulator [Leptospiraceae bacterium]|nr:MAG: transcriptional regulator [Leptospiraceae bacterium]
MAVLGKLGEKLKNTRESKGYSIREVSEHTHITPKYIEALEQEDYAIFPSETYIVGFLRTYAEFLGLNPEEIIREYKGLKVQISDTPVEKLTEITKPKFEIDYNLITRIAIIVFIVVFIGIGIYYLGNLFSNLKNKKSFTTQIYDCKEREIKPLKIELDQPFLSLMDITQNYELSIPEIGKMNLCISEPQITNEPKSLKLEILYQGNSYPIQTNSNETIVLSNIISELANSPVQIEISIKDIMESSSQLEIIAKKKDIVSKKPITVVLEIVQDTYLEWTSDGKSYRGILLKQGDIRILEAETRLDIKIGNGAGVKYHLGDLPPKIAGPPGKIVKISLRKIPDPLDPTKFKIDELVQVAQ